MTVNNDRSSKKKQNIFWPEIDSKETAREVANQGFWAAIVVAVVTTIVILITMAAGTLEDIPPIDAWAFIDVGIFVAIALGIRKMSRIAAVSGLVVYLIERIYALSYTGGGGGLFIAIALILAFINGVRGTFAYHRLRRQSLEETSPILEGER